MDAAGDVIQALATFLNLEDLHSTADFPKDMETLRQILVQVRQSSYFGSTYPRGAGWIPTVSLVWK